MGIAVKKGDTFTLGVNGIAAITVRLVLNFRPQSWWTRIIRFILGADPYNFSVDVVSNTDRSKAAAVGLITQDGEIDSADIRVVAGTVPSGPGESFVQAVLSRPDANSEFALLIADYLSSNFNPSWPGNAVQSPLEGPGRLVETVTSDPAANAEIGPVTVPANARWRPHAFSVQLVQGITQTPLPTLRVRNSAGGVEAQVPITTTAIGASSTAQLTWARGLVQSSFTAVIGDEFHTAPMPMMDMISSADLGTVTDGKGANTDYGAARLKIEEWIAP